jgi:hypothetical protein
MLTRDSRVVERKKYGKAKARKSFQFSKRWSFKRRLLSFRRLQEIATFFIYALLNI